MALVTSTEMFKKAYDGGYAIGAFNVNNMEIIQGITEAAAELQAPLILQVSKGARAYANRTYLKKLVEAADIETGLPIVLHLDHGDSFETCKSCIEDGFTSVMIDAFGLVSVSCDTCPRSAPFLHAVSKNGLNLFVSFIVGYFPPWQQKYSVCCSLKNNKAAARIFRWGRRQDNAISTAAIRRSTP